MHKLPYSTGTIRIPDTLSPDNSSSANPLEFDIAPAWGPDLAKIRSVVESCGVTAGRWTPETQVNVIKAFETSTGAFVNTITAVRGLSVPLRMAQRAGIFEALKAGTTADPESDFLITTGGDFGRLSGDPNMLGIVLYIAFEIMKLSRSNQVDQRLFMQPSGSGGAGTETTKASTAGSAAPRRGARGTAGKK